MLEHSPRLQREERTVRLMIGLYCRLEHRRKQLCPQCAELQAYTQLRLSKCPFQERKPTCTKCPVHCYQPEKRAQIRRVMRFSGPRMLLYHPLLAIRHLLDGRSRSNP